MMFVNDECEEVMRFSKYGNEVLKGRVLRGVEVGLWIESLTMMLLIGFKSVTHTISLL